MNKNQKISAIRQKCIEANPEIVELKFGCEVMCGGAKRPFLVPFTVVGKNYAGNWLMSTGLDRGITTVLKEKELVRVIGRPILAQDIQKILPKWWMMKWDGGLERFEFVNMHNYGNASFENRYFPFNDTPLSEQSDGCIDFIYSLIK